MKKREVSKQMHDFDDGRGPQPAHWHANGGGWVEETCEVVSVCYVNRDSEIFGGSRIVDSRVDDSRVCNNHRRPRAMQHPGKINLSKG